MIKRSPSRILLIGGGSFLLGIILACSFPSLITLRLIDIIIIIVIAIISYRQPSIFLITLIALGVFLGIYRFQNSSGFWQKQKIPREVFLQTTIKREPLIKHNLQRIIIPPLLLYLPVYPEYLPGDVVRIKGRSSPLKEWRIIQSSFVSFQIKYPQIRLIKSSKWSLRRISYKIKKRAQDSLQQIMPQPDGGIMVAILFGNKTFLSHSLLKQIKKAGLSYIIVVSGLHLVIIGKIISTMLLALKVSQKKRLLISLLALLGFIYLIGPSPSIIRAGIMSLLLIIGELNYRQYSSSRGLWLAALIMVGSNPLIVKSLSFQLSFLATAGIVYLYPLLKNLPIIKNVSSSKLGQGIMLYFLPSLAAFLAVTPWLFYQIGTASLLAPLSSLLIIPIIPSLMAGGWLVIILANLNYFLALLVGFFLRIVSHYLLVILKIFSFLPLSQVIMGPNWRWLIFPYYLIIIFLTLRYYHQQKINSNLYISNE